MSGDLERWFGLDGRVAIVLLWLCGPGARFVTGTTTAVDGGFSAFSGV
jgi:NAD(P)-dependent dehydrogenase (short-subunit alcohol dehydrogenase family)